MNIIEKSINNLDKAEVPVRDLLIHIYFMNNYEGADVYSYEMWDYEILSTELFLALPEIYNDIYEDNFISKEDILNHLYSYKNFELQRLKYWCMRIFSLTGSNNFTEEHLSHKHWRLFIWFCNAFYDNIADLLVNKGYVRQVELNTLLKELLYKYDIRRTDL